MQGCSSRELIDGQGRKIENLRISITDRCNLRCTYCMPEEGVEWRPKDEILSFEEILSLVETFHSYGIHKVRLSGGEPTLRKDLVKLVRGMKKICDGMKISITTNGLLLAKIASELQKSGISNVNISLDSLNSETFREITRVDSFEKVMEGIKAALSTPFGKVKINAVAMKDVSMAELDEIVKFSRENGVVFRFIEIMPFSGNNWEKQQFISKKEMLEYLNGRYNVVAIESADKSSTSRVYDVEGARIGFIASVTESFCEFCNRVRITTEGNLRTCLHSSKEYPLRNHIGTEKLTEVIEAAVKEKWEGHPDFLNVHYKPPVDDRAMILIGG